MAAGVMQFTRISEFASSLPSVFVNPITPAFEAAYPAMQGLPSFPATEAMFTIRP